ncbi:hypothetical protein IG631_13104 [Alternaria alternata]|nr:hypothetical protein IG631_13104 [Alternaria alternata]
MHILIGFATWERTSDCSIPALWINQTVAMLLARSSQDCAHRQVSLRTSNVIKRPDSLCSYKAQRQVERRGYIRHGVGKAVRARC